MPIRLVHLFLLAALVAAPAGASAFAPDRIAVVASFSILADFARNVGGDRVAVTPLVGANGDAHSYAPSPADATKLAAAKLVVVNGLGFEGWIERLIAASGTEVKVLIASTGIAPRRQGNAADPHAWQSVANVKIYVANIRDALKAADPAGAASYEENAGAYLRRLDALDAELRSRIGAIPPDRRKIIIDHDAFAYFSAAYGVAFIAPQGVSTQADVSARDIARIIAQIRTEKIPAVFLENMVDPRLLRLIARETGTRVGGVLFSDALTDESGPAPTYIDMMRHNADALATTLSD